MNKENTSPESKIPTYITRSREILEIEIEHYLRKRREVNDISEPPTKDNLTGLCISGGGVRSATLGLGMIQAFIKAGKMKYFDYLSTVSGGGYIGSCLSSLLSKEPARRDKVKNARPEEQILNENQRYNVEDYGLEENNSPFTHEPYEYPKLQHAKLNTRHQLVHLRQHGEYLTPHKGILEWDVHRLVGALFGGIVTNISTFILLLSVLVLLHHFLLALMSDGKFIDQLQDPANTANVWVKKQQVGAYIADSLTARSEGLPGPQVAPSLLYTPLDSVYKKVDWEKLSTTQQLNYWASSQFLPQVALIWLGVCKHWDIALAFGAIGLALSLFFILWARSLPYRLERQEQDEQNYTGEAPKNRFYKRRGEQDMLDSVEMSLINVFYYSGFFGVPLAAYLLTALITGTHGDKFNFFVMLALPFCYSAGLYLGLHILAYLFFLNNDRQRQKERVSGWLYRSFYNGLQGGALLMMVVTFLFPLAIIMLFGNHGLAVKLSFSFVPVIVAYYFTMQSLGARVGGGGFITGVMNKLQNPLLNLSIWLFVGLAFAWISQGIYPVEQYLCDQFHPYFTFCGSHSRTVVVGVMFLISLALLVLLGFFVNSNDVSLHYFYRDRLTEAYLRTIGRVEVHSPDDLGAKGLRRVTLRNHEDLKLKDLGNGSYRGPYHIIVTALNLQGSHDLSAKTLKSEHFIFSKFFIGSRSTGYANTSLYDSGSTKLSTAMAISAAAISSGMGPIGFTASNFYMTLFNLRTGYWIDNPKHFIKLLTKQDRAKSADRLPPVQGKKIWTRKNRRDLWWDQKKDANPFWHRYIWRELRGDLSADYRKVYVSDGGHTGDNLGLLPLIQRQCCTIVVADFEEDGTYSFESFSQAVRLAKSIYNADICIDLSSIMPKTADSGDKFSPSSVAKGEITYNIVEEKRGKDGEIISREFKQKKGTLIYMKSSVSLLKDAEEPADKTHQPKEEEKLPEKAPVYVLNYFKKNPKFPHQSTADQYFDEVQFEAYRMLGEHIGKQASVLLPTVI